MFRPSDLQLVLLTGAAQRADGSLLPPPESIGGQAARIRRSIPPLLKNGLVSEAAVGEASLAWRQEGDTKFGAFITDVGRKMIGAEKPQPQAAAELTDEQTPNASADQPATETKTTKAALVLGLLRREQGATLDELVTATGWLPHTTRAALTGLRKKGHGIAKGKRGEVTCYSLPRAA